YQSKGVFMLKYNTNGALQWLIDLTNTTATAINENIAVTEQGEIYYVTDSPYANGYLKKYNTNGVLQWTRNTPQSPFGQQITSIGVDKTGNAYLAAAYAAPITLGTINLPSNPSAPFNPTYFIAKINKSGAWKWVTEIENSRSNRIKLPKKINETFSIAGEFSAPLNLADSTFTNGQTFIAKMDTLGSVLQARRLITKNGYWNLLETIAMDPNGNTYLAGSYQNNITIGSFQLNTTGSTYTSRYLTKLQDYTNALTGTVFRDLNGNGIQDSGEQPFSERILEITPGPIYVNTLPSGNYGTFLPAGNFSISLPNPPRHYTVAPASHSFSFAGQNQSLAGKDFALQPIPNSPDVKITLTPATPARPGFALVYNLTFTNVGTTILADSLDLTFNAGLLTFQSATVLPAVQQTGKLKWTYQNLQPTEKRSINVFFHLDSTAVIGNNLQAIATIKPLVTDLFQQDNFDTLNQVITGSFDPNDKLVNFERLTPAEVNNGKALDYTIRFQNTGTDTAFTVVVRDVFSKNLDLKYFEVLAVSHPYTFKLLSNGNAEWRFDNILLPDSNRNEPASHGFIRYRMKPKTSLVLGDEIKERAAIYFDYNAPVMTNYAITRIANPLSLKEPKAGLQPFQLYPNPAQNYVMVAAELKKPTAATVRLVNILGQTISEVTLPANNQLHYQLPLNNLPKGVYIVQLETENGRQAQRLVVQ
ncbi:MAG TPA: T9SS type A sorting domain-containing protein, partial [Adhaeribacter sp.]|nr:T9SS type A sorting domain-containing protein [Adhaeribacter sp.]